jgi:hypothetical protein
VTSLTAQMVANAAIAGLALALAYIALSGRRYERIGREALLCTSAYLLFSAVSRMLLVADVIGSETARVLTGAAAVAALAILAQLAWLKHVDHIHRKEHHP